MSEYNELIYTTKRQDNLTKLRKQTAANALQQYSLLAIKSLNDCKVKLPLNLIIFIIFTSLNRVLPELDYS